MHQYAYKLLAQEQDEMARHVTVNASEGHRRFGKLLKRVYGSDENLIVERDGFPVAVLIVEPLQLYLYGSVLTDKPNPRDVDLILVYEYPRKFDFNKNVTAMMYGKPTASDRAIINLRRGMKMFCISPTRTSLANWQDQALLLIIRPRLIWKPGANWEPVVKEIEVSPEP